MWKKKDYRMCVFRSNSYLSTTISSSLEIEQHGQMYDFAQQSVSSLFSFYALSGFSFAVLHRFDSETEEEENQLIPINFTVLPFQY